MVYEPHGRFKQIQPETSAAASDIRLIKDLQRQVGARSAHPVNAGWICERHMPSLLLA